MKEELLLRSFDKWRNWSTKNLRDPPNISQLGCDKAGTRTQEVWLWIDAVELGFMGHRSHRIQDKFCTWSFQWVLPPGPVYNDQTPGLWGSTRTGLGTCQNTCSLMTGRALQFSVSTLSLTHFGALMPGMSHSYFLVLHTQKYSWNTPSCNSFWKSQRTQSFHIFPVLVSISIYATSEKHSFHSIVQAISSGMLAYWRRPIFPKFWFKRHSNETNTHT